jgi:hypothetical protein
LIQDFERKNPNPTGVAVYVGLFFLIGFAGYGGLSPENIVARLENFEKKGLNTIGPGFSQGFILGIIQSLITLPPHTRKMKHIIKPSALICRSGVIQDDNKRVCAQGTSHTAVGAASKNFRQMAVVDCCPNR